MSRTRRLLSTTRASALPSSRLCSRFSRTILTSWKTRNQIRRRGLQSSGSDQSVLTSRWMRAPSNVLAADLEARSTLDRSRESTGPVLAPKPISKSTVFGCLGAHSPAEFGRPKEHSPFNLCATETGSCCRTDHLHPNQRFWFRKTSVLCKRSDHFATRTSSFLTN